MLNSPFLCKTTISMYRLLGLFENYHFYVISTISMYKLLSLCENYHIYEQTTISMWKLPSLCTNYYISKWKLPSLQTTISMYKQLSLCKNNYLYVKTIISMYKQLSLCTNNYLYVQTFITVSSIRVSVGKCLNRQVSKDLGLRFQFRDFSLPDFSTFIATLYCSWHVSLRHWASQTIYMLIGSSLTRSATSVTSKKLPNVYKSCPKMISLGKLKILTPLQKLPKMYEIWAN